MKFITGQNTEQLVESIDYLNQPQPNDHAPAPRCSLDFFIELDDGTQLDDKTLRIQHFSGHESLSDMFELSVTLHANTFTSSGLDQPWGDLIEGEYGQLLTAGSSTAQHISFESILGAKASIRMGLPETSEDIASGTYPDDRPVVFFNGIITNFSMTQRGVYQATIKPALYKLSLQNNYRLFSQQTILDVIMQLLSENNIDFNRKELEAKPNKIICGLANYRKQDWLQAGETDLAFLQRLMGKVNLFYYFKHVETSHEMVIADQPYYQNIYQRAVNLDTRRFEETQALKPLYLSFSKQQSVDRDDYITQFSYQQNLTSSGIKTVLAQKEANWESQKTAQTSPVYLDKVNTTEKLNMELLHVVQYGATEKEIETITNSSMNKLLASRFSFSGASTCNEMKPGYQFLVKERDETRAESGGNSGADLRRQSPIFPTLNDRVFVVTSVKHQATVEGDYSNQFQAVDAGGLATPFSAQTGNMGSILAQVIDNSAAKQAQADSSSAQVQTNRQQGASDKYLTKDVFSYDSKHFYFDADAQESYKCKGIYVRFIDEAEDAAPHWVKLAEHMQTIPEVDSYVTVGRSNDDNEIPEVQQSLQAKGSKVIMPDDYTCHTNVGNNYSTNYGDNTSISFGADVQRPLSYAKHIVETQRKSNQYNGVSYSESSSYGYSISPRSHNLSRTGDGPDLDFNPASMSQYVSYGQQATYGDTYNESEQQGNSTSKNTQIGTSSNHHTQHGHSYSESTQTGGSTSVSSVDTSTNTSQVGTSSGTSIVGQSSQISVTGSASNLSTTGTSMGSSLTGMSMNSSLTGISINASLTGLSTSTNLTGLSQSTGLVGIASNTNLTGISDSTNLTGVSSSVGLTGVSDSTNITGVSSSMNVTGSHSSLSATGDNTSISVTGSDLTVNLVGSGASINQTMRTDLAMKNLALDIISSLKMVL